MTVNGSPVLSNSQAEIVAITPASNNIPLSALPSMPPYRCSTPPAYFNVPAQCGQSPPVTCYSGLVCLFVALAQRALSLARCWRAVFKFAHARRVRTQVSWAILRPFTPAPACGQTIVITVESITGDVDYASLVFISDFVCAAGG